MDARPARRRLAASGVRAALLLRGSVVAAVMLSAGDLLGAEDAATVYEAPPECPKAHVFEAEVEKRSPGTTASNARVAITGSARAGYEGRVILDGQARDIQTATCEEAVQALALAVAMAAIDDAPDAAGGDDSLPEPRVLPTASPPPDEDQTAANDPSPSVTGPRPLFGLALGATGGVGPGLAPALAIFGGLDLGGRTIRLGIGGARSGAVATDLGSARFTRVGLYVDGCPISLRRGALELSPCVRLDGGVLRGSGESLENAEATALPWLAASAGGRLLADVTPAFFLEAEARAVAPLLRHTFFVRPNDRVYRMPLVTAEAFISVGHRFSK